MTLKVFSLRFQNPSSFHSFFSPHLTSRSSLVFTAKFYCVMMSLRCLHFASSCHFAIPFYSLSLSLLKWSITFCGYRFCELHKRAERNERRRAKITTRTCWYSQIHFHRFLALRTSEQGFSVLNFPILMYDMSKSSFHALWIWIFIRTKIFLSSPSRLFDDAVDNQNFYLFLRRYDDKRQRLGRPSCGMRKPVDPIAQYIFHMFP